MGRQCSRASRFCGLGLKTTTRLLRVGRGLDKIEAQKKSDGHVATIAGLRRIEAKKTTRRAPSDEHLGVVFPFMPSGFESM